MSINTKTNSRMPLSHLNRSKNETIFTKFLKNRSLGNSIIIKIFSIMTKELPKSVITITLEVKKSNIYENEEMFSNIEYTKCIVKALNEALDENEKVSIIVIIWQIFKINQFLKYLYFPITFIYF